MPSDVTAELSRIVVDEASFDFHGLTDGEVEAGLDEFNDALATLFSDGNGVATSSLCWEIPCRDDCELHEFLFNRETSEVDRDTLVRCQWLLDRCPAWDELVPEVCTDVQLDGEELSAAFSVGFALTMAQRRRGVACLVFPGVARHGFRVVSGEVGEAEVFFFADPGRLRLFWRHLFELENVDERNFLTYALPAFPDLVLHPDLKFEKFEGSYPNLRHDVVVALGVINDEFERVHAECSRQGKDVTTALRFYGLDASLESPSTHKSQKFMRQRSVGYGEYTYLCEWHAKLEPHRNRIHFTLPEKGPDNRILVGIFVKHLDS